MKESTIKNKKETRGGKRPFSGRKKANYKTEVITFRVRSEITQKVKTLVKDFVQNYKFE